MNGLSRATIYGYSLWEFEVLKAVASSYEYAGLEASKATDGDMSSRWSSEFTDNEWIYIDYMWPIDFDTVILNWQIAYGSQYEIQVSNDATDWTTIYVESAGDGGEDSIYVGSQTARYIKMNGIQRGTVYGYSLWEFKVENNTPPTQGEIMGEVNLQSRTYQAEIITFELRNPGQTTAIKTFQMVSGSDGKYIFPHIEPGTYDITAKTANSLKDKVINVEVTAQAITSGINFNLLTGDADNNNFVNAFDNSVLNGAFGSMPGDANWDNRADFDNNKVINAFDNSILNGNFGKAGAQ